MIHRTWFALSASRARTIGACVLLALGSLVSSLVAEDACAAITVPPGFTVENVTPGASFDTPVTVAFLPDGRMLVGEKRGQLYVVANGVKHPTPMWSEEDRVQSDGDRGLLSVAVDPNFDVNRYVYLLYTVDPGSNAWEMGPGFGRLVRYTVSSVDSNAFEPASRTVLLGVDWPDGPPVGSITHTVGMLRFGSDGSLLISVGEGADFHSVDDGGKHPDMFGPGKADPDEDIGAFRALYLNSKAGKILRLNPDNGQGYPSNPFYDGDPTSDRSKIWAYGLRNPYRFTVKPNSGSALPTVGDPGTLYIGDVGWATWEELNIANQPGMNFGWPCYEGMGETPEYQAEGAPAHTDCGSFGTPDNPSLPSPPTAVWHHTTGGLSVPAGLRGSASIGGVFYEGSTYPTQYQNNYFVADFSFNWIKVMVMDSNDQFLTLLNFAEDADGPVDLAVDPISGDLIYISIYTNEIRRIRYASGPGNSPPVADLDATPVAGVAPLTVYFSSDASFDPDGDPLTISWLFGDGQGSAADNPQHEYTMPGSYTAVLTVEDGLGGVARDSMIIVVADEGSVFPTTPVLDTFNRPDGALGSPWVGQIGGMSIENNALVHDPPWSWGVWDDQVFGDTQEAYFTLEQITGTSPEHDLMLKIQGTSWQDGCIEVRYDAQFGHVRVGTYMPGAGWDTHNTFPATIQAGDQLGARAYPNGLVEVYVNGVMVQASSVAGWPFAAAGGRLGMTLVDADTSRIDDFGGGNAVLNPNFPPQATITTPIDGAFFAAGDTLFMTGTASDDMDPHSALTHRWQIDLHHNVHIHPSTFVSNDSTAFYVVFDHDDGSGVWYNVHYIVTDTGGKSDTATVAVHPEIDLEPSAVIFVPDPPNNTGVTHFLFDLRNHGRMPAPQSRWRITAGGITLAEGDTAVAALDSVSIAAAVAPVLVAGDYDLRVVVDTLDAIVEMDEANNGANRELTVFPAPVAVGPTVHGLALSNAYPNPSAGPVRLGLSLPHEALVEFAVHDLQGRIVWRTQPQRFRPGRHDLEWTGHMSGGHRARAGLYLARVRVDGRIMTRRLAILR